MPGIFGVISSSPVDLASQGQAMARALRHHPWYLDQQHTDPPSGLFLGRVYLGAINASPQPATNEEGTLLALLEGEILDPDHHRQQLESAGHRFQGQSHAEILLHGVEQFGDAFARQIQGSFSAAVWDVRLKRLTLLSDRFGLKPLYYALVPDKFLFASEIKALLLDPAVSRQPNACGLAQFFTFSHLFANDTLLDGVRLVPAATWLTWDTNTGQLDQRVYWRVEAQPSQITSERDALDRVASTLKKAVDRRTQGPGKLGLSLSGGLDARTLLGLIDNDRPVTTVCLGMEGSMDLRSAAEMASLTGREYHPYVLDTRFLSRFEHHLRHLVHLTDGHYLDQVIVMPTLPFYRQLGIQVLLRGHAGELMHMDKAYNFSLDDEALSLRDSAGIEDWLFRHLQAHMLAGVGEGLFTSRYRGQLTELSRSVLRECLQESEHLQPPLHRIWHLFITQRLRRETALSMVEFGSVVETRLPFLDSDVIEALFSLPAEWKIGDRIQAHTLRRYRPEFLNVLNANTGARMGAGKLTVTLSKLRMKVFAKLGVKGYQPYERLGLWLRRDLSAIVEKILLDDRCLSRGVFEPAVVRSVVDGHLNQGRNHTFLLMALMIFELGQREFIDGETYQPSAD